MQPSFRVSDAAEEIRRSDTEGRAKTEQVIRDNAAQTSLISLQPHEGQPGPMGQRFYTQAEDLALCSYALARMYVQARDGGCRSQKCTLRFSSDGLIARERARGRTRPNLHGQLLATAPTTVGAAFHGHRRRYHCDSSYPHELVITSFYARWISRPEARGFEGLHGDL